MKEWMKGFHEEWNKAAESENQYDGATLNEVFQAAAESLGGDKFICAVENCGRKCVHPNIIQKVGQVYDEVKDIDVLIERLNEFGIGGGHLRREQNKIYASYDRCYCGHAANYKEQIPGAYCNCSRGWFLELFEQTLKAPVKVELVNSIIKGGEKCEFIITLE